MNKIRIGVIINTVKIYTYFYLLYFKICYQENLFVNFLIIIIFILLLIVKKKLPK